MLEPSKSRTSPPSLHVPCLAPPQYVHAQKRPQNQRLNIIRAWVDNRSDVRSAFHRVDYIGNGSIDDTVGRRYARPQGPAHSLGVLAQEVLPAHRVRIGGLPA